MQEGKEVKADHTRALEFANKKDDGRREERDEMSHTASDMVKGLDDRSAQAITSERSDTSLEQLRSMLKAEVSEARESLFQALHERDQEVRAQFDVLDIAMGGLHKSMETLDIELRSQGSAQPKLREL